MKKTKYYTWHANPAFSEPLALVAQKKQKEEKEMDNDFLIAFNPRQISLIVVLR